MLNGGRALHSNVPPTVCELVGLFILDKLRTDFPEIDAGLYRDDGLGASKPISKRLMEQKKKALLFCV